MFVALDKQSVAVCLYRMSRDLVHAGFFVAIPHHAGFDVPPLSSVQAASDGPSPPPSSHRGTSDADRPSEVGQLVRLVSLDSELPADAMSALTLEDAITMSLARNPDLVAVRASEPVAHAAFHVAETYPWNPQFQTQVLPYSRDRNGEDGADQPATRDRADVRTWRTEAVSCRGGGGQLGTGSRHDPARRTDERGPDHPFVFCGASTNVNCCT